MNIIFIIGATILFTCLIGIFIFLIKSNPSARQQTSNQIKPIECIADDDCRSDQKCIFVDDLKQNKCISKSLDYCQLKSTDDLITCTANGNECNKCVNGSFEESKGLEFTCVNVTDKNIKNYQTILPTMSTGSYCLPNITSQNCNSSTSDTVLSRNIDGGMTWDCLCKSTNKLFEYDPITKDCNKLIACNNGKYPLYSIVKDADNHLKTCKKQSECNTTSDEVCWDSYGNNIEDVSTEKGFCFTNWKSDKNMADPISNGVCKCQPGQMPFKTVDAAGNVLLECVNDTCNIGGKSILSSGNIASCKCSTGYISCSDINTGTTPPNPFFAQKKLKCKFIPQCLPDPCQVKTCSNAPNTVCKSDSQCPGGTCNVIGGNFNATTGQCVCPTGYFLNSNDPLSYVKYSCYNPCNTNPCGSRGTCSVNVNSGKAVCNNCNSPYSNDGDDTKQCRTLKKTDGQPCTNNLDCYSNKCIDIQKTDTGIGISITVYPTQKICDST